jgi:hypothetical protein
MFESCRAHVEAVTIRRVPRVMAVEAVQAGYWSLRTSR